MHFTRLLFLVALLVPSLQSAASEDVTLPQPLTDAEADAIVAQQFAAKAEPERPKIDFQVLERSEIDLGGRKLIFNRVAPPDLPEPKPKITAPQPEPTPEEIAAYEATMAQQVVKEHQILFLSAMIYDNGVTELTWHEKCQSFRAYSNAGFEYLPGTFTFETADAVYMVLMSKANRTAQDIQKHNAMVQAEALPAQYQWSYPTLPAFTPERVEYFLELEPEEAMPEADSLTAVDAVHLYYEQYAPEIQIEHQRSQALQAAKKRYLEANSPAPKGDTVINFWRVK